MKFYRTLLPIFPLLVAAAACSETAQQELGLEWRELTPPATATATGFQRQQPNLAPDSEVFIATGGSVDQAQLTRLFYLSWPQSSGAIADLLGSPALTSPSAGLDHYQMPNGHRLTVHYRNGAAIGYSLGDSAEEGQL